MSQTHHIIIIGNGAAGTAALEQIIKHKSPHHQVTVITDENLPPYYRPMLSEYLSSESLPNRFFLHTEKWYEENGVQWLSGCKVQSIDSQKQVLITDDCKEGLFYDNLILATGSYNFIPPIKGHHLSQVYQMKTLEDAEKIKSSTAHMQHAVIIGGGLLGLEAGWQLKKQGIEVKVIEMMDRLLPRQLDPEASERFEHLVSETGIQVIKDAQVVEITGEQVVSGVKLASGEFLKADFLLFSIGVRPHIELTKQTALEVNRGFIVNDSMETSIPGIYAAGDCAEYDGTNFCIWPEALAQGRVAGLNAMGIESIYEPITPFHMYHGMNLRLFSIGDVGTDPSREYTSHVQKNNDHFMKCFFFKGTLCGAILIGDIKASAYLKKALQEKTDEHSVLKQLFEK